MDEITETETKPPTATMPVDLLNEVTAVILDRPAGEVFDLLTRLRAEVVLNE